MTGMPDLPPPLPQENGRKPVNVDIEQLAEPRPAPPVEITAPPPPPPAPDVPLPPPADLPPLKAEEKPMDTLDLPSLKAEQGKKHEAEPKPEKKPAKKETDGKKPRKDELVVFDSEKTNKKASAKKESGKKESVKEPKPIITPPVPEPENAKPSLPDAPSEPKLDMPVLPPTSPDVATLPAPVPAEVAPAPIPDAPLPAPATQADPVVTPPPASAQEETSLFGNMKKSFGKFIGAEPETPVTSTQPAQVAPSPPEAVVPALPSVLPPSESPAPMPPTDLPPVNPPSALPELNMEPVKVPDKEPVAVLPHDAPPPPPLPMEAVPPQPPIMPPVPPPSTDQGKDKPALPPLEMLDKPSAAPSDAEKPPALPPLSMLNEPAPSPPTAVEPVKANDLPGLPELPAMDKPDIVSPPVPAPVTPPPALEPMPEVKSGELGLPSLPGAEPAPKPPVSDVASLPPAEVPAAAPDTQAATGAPEYRIVFNSTETDVPLSKREQLNTLSETLFANKNTRINLMAYAAGTTEENGSFPKRVSLARGVAVRAYIGEYLENKHGVDSSKEALQRINVKAMGSKNAGGEPDRVDLFVIK
jgi:hypothetical protein